MYLKIGVSNYNVAEQMEQKKYCTQTTKGKKGENRIP